MFFLAFRHLISRKRQSAFTLLGIVLGTAAYVVISGMMLGFQTFLLEQFVNNDGHIRITARDERITQKETEEALFKEHQKVLWSLAPQGRRNDKYIGHPQGWFDRLANDSEVAAFAPQLLTQALVRKTKDVFSVRLIGIEPTKQSRVTNLPEKILSGSLNDLVGSGQRVLVGNGLLDKLGARVGDTLYLSAGRGDSLAHISGTFSMGIKSLDDGVIYANLNQVQKINGTPSEVSDIIVRLVDFDAISRVRDKWRAFSRDLVQSWDEANEGTLSVFKTQDIVRNSMTISILIVAAFGIYNILSMVVAQKKKEIAILRSIGFEPKDIVELFLIQGVVLGVLGALIGVALGYVGCLGMSQIEVSKDRMLGGNKMLVSFNTFIYVKAAVLAMSSAVVASLLPARTAGRMNPIEIIREG